ncbi:MAG: zinc ribbon domain-containing protein [Actinobacteria bacterium]|nr:zinc ribbon domain-containing protein [Actinomycetota bacterium]
MFCMHCGKEIADDARFCESCGASVETRDSAQAAAPRSPGPPPVPTPPGGDGGYGGYGAPPPPKRNRTGLWIGIAVAVAIVVAAAAAIPLLLLGGDDDSTTVVTGVTTTTSTAGAETTTTAPVGSSTTAAVSTSTSSPAVAVGPAGDSEGAWVAVPIPELPVDALVMSAAVSEEALLIRTMREDEYWLYGYLFDTGTLVELPIGAAQCWGEDLDGLLAVWWEGDFDQDTYEPYNDHVIAYLLPNGPRVQVTDDDRDPFYPQVAGSRITWTEAEPWETNPEEYSDQRIYAVDMDAAGRPAGEPLQLVSTATAFTFGDSVWTYSLSASHLTWENDAPHGVFETGSYMLDLADDSMPRKLGRESWRASLFGDIVVYWDEVLMMMDLTTMATHTIDINGDFATAGPTYAAYFRSRETGENASYEILTRGYTTGLEHVLATTTVVPYFSPAIATSATRVTAVIDDALHLFEWRGPDW